MSSTFDELKIIVKAALEKATMPKNHRGAFIAYIDDAGMRYAVAYRADTGWEVGNFGWHYHENGLAIGINILKTW